MFMAARCQGIFVVIHEFECHGWQVEVGHLGNPMRFNELHQLIGQGLRWQATPYVPFSAVATIPALFLPSSRQECQEDATDSARTSQARSSPNRKKISSNIAPTTPMHRHALYRLREIPSPQYCQRACQRYPLTA